MELQPKMKETKKKTKTPQKTRIINNFYQLHHVCPYDTKRLYFKTPAKDLTMRKPESGTAVKVFFY